MTGAGAHRASLLAALLLTACGQPGPARPSGVLITLDTTRADALGFLGGPDVSPHLDRLAAESVVYAEARTVTPQTMPSHASMFTGLYPPRHTVRDNNLTPLPGAAVTLAERAREAGLRTAAFVSSVGVDRAFGFDQGFDVYDQPSAGYSPTGEGMRPDAETAERAVAWIRALEGDAPFFLWVHFFAPHEPLTPPERFRRQTRGDLYHAEVGAMDDAVGEVERALREVGALDRALLVVVADHGEALGDHGEATHCAYVYDSTIRVPFFVRHPDGRRAGERSRERASVVDVYPTFLDALQLGDPGDVDGLDLHRATLPADRGVYFESFFGYLSYGWSPLSGWADADGLYLHSSEPLVYGPAGTQGAGRAPTSADAERVARWRAAIGAVAARAPLVTTDEHVDEAKLDELRALGYAASTGALAQDLPSPLDVAGRPSPQSRLREHLRTFEALNLSIRGRPRASIPIFQDLLAQNPDNVVAVEGLAACLTLDARYEEAAAAWRRLLARGVHGARASYNLAVVLHELGQDVEAHEALLRALDADPEHVGARSLLEQLERVEPAPEAADG